jgi:hypothetical protein
MKLLQTYMDEIEKAKKVFVQSLVPGENHPYPKDLSKAGHPHVFQAFVDISKYYKGDYEKAAEFIDLTRNSVLIRGVFVRILRWFDEC